MFTNLEKWISYFTYHGITFVHRSRGEVLSFTIHGIRKWALTVYGKQAFRAHNFLVVFDCESGVRRSNLILLYFWRGFGVSQFVLFFISQDYKISLPLSTSDAFPEKQLLVSQLSWIFSVLISWNRFCWVPDIVDLLSFSPPPSGQQN